MGHAFREHWMNNKNKGIGTMAAVGIMAALVVAPVAYIMVMQKNYLSPIFYPLPKPTGTYGIGDVLYQLHDLKWPEHDFMIRCWYPADIPQQCSDKYGDMITNSYVIKQLARETHIPIFLLHKSFDFCTYSTLNVPLSSIHQAYPIIFFLPGNGASYHYYTALIEDLVSHGYIIIGINTTPLNPTLFLDGKFIEHNQDFFAQEGGVHSMMDRCVTNTARAVDWLAIMNNDSKSIWYHRIDMNKLGIMGNSLGGSAAVEVARHDRHFTVGINLDGWLQMKTTNAIPIPFLFLMNDSLFPPGKDEGMEEIQKTCAASGDHCTVHIIPGSGHNSFADFAFYKWPFSKLGDPGKGDPYRVLKDISNKIWDFLAINLSRGS